MHEAKKIDVWYLIEKTINIFPPLYALAFIGIYAYGQSYRTISQSLEIPVADLKRWNKKIERKVRKVLKQNGANLKYISDTHGLDYIFEILPDTNETEGGTE